MARETLGPIPLPGDSDYVAGFSALAELERHIRRCGPEPELILRRSMLQADLGNLGMALRAAQEAIEARHGFVEAYFHEGLCWLMVARVHVGGAALGPAAELPPRHDLRGLLQRAYQAFCAVLRHEPDDPDALAQAHWLERLLEMDTDARRRAFEGR